MRIGNVKPFKQALNTPVLAPPSVQRIERHIRGKRQQLLAKIFASINRMNIMAQTAECRAHLLTGRQRDLTLCAWPAHQYCNFKGVTA